MKFLFATIWCITFASLQIFSCTPPPITLSIKAQAEKIIRVQQDFRRICNAKIHDKEPRKAIKAQLNKIIFFCNKAYSQADNEECAKTFLQQAQEVADAVRKNSLIKSAKAAL